MRAARFPPLLRCAFLLLVIVASAAANTCIHTVGDPAAASAFTRLADAPVLSVDASCTQTSDTLYVMGGFGPLTPQVTLPPTNAAFAFDLNTNEWKALAAVPFAGSRTQAANNGTHIFLVGGFEGNSPGTPRTGAHVYSIAEDKWTELPSLPLATGGGGLAVVGSQLIYMSGQTGEGVYALTILVLDLTAPTAWTAFPGALYPSPRADFLALVFNTTAAEIVFTAGGDIGTERDPIDLNTTLAFTPATGAFEELAQMPVPRSHYGGAVVPVSGAANCCPARVILLGGRSQQNAAVLADIVEYSPEEDIWTTIANLPHQWYTPCAAVHTNASGSFLFVTGGGLDFFFPTNDTWVAPLAAGCNTPTVPVVPPAPPATVPVTVPPSVTGAAIGNAAAAATTTAAGPVAVAAVTGVSTATTGAGATTGAATTSAPPTSGTAPPTTGTAPPTTGTTAPTTGTTAPTTPPTTAPTTPPTTAPTTGTTPPTAAPPTTPPTPPPTSIIPVSRTLTTGVTFNRASLNAALATALAGSPFTAAGGGTTGLRTVATLNGVAFAGRPTLSPLAPTGKQANDGAPLAHYPPLLALCLVALLGAHLLVH